MEKDPYQSAADAPSLPLPLRLRRGLSVLLVIATLTVTLFAWDVVNYNFTNGWASFPWQLFRIIVPIALTYAIWTGRSWARFALAIFCLFTIYANVPLVQQMGRVLATGNVGDIGMIVLAVGGNAIIAGLAVFSQRITDLIVYRREEEDLG